MARVMPWLLVCSLSIANAVFTYSELKSRLAMMEYGNENNTPVVPDFLNRAVTMTYVANIRGEIQGVDENTNEIRGQWSNVILVKLAYIAFLTGNVLEPPKLTSNHLNYTIWFVDECMNYYTRPVQCSAPYAMKKFLQIISGNELVGVPYPPSDATVGATTNMLEAAHLSGLQGIPMVGYSSSVTTLSDKSLYPTYLRTKFSMRAEAMAVALYLRRINNYTRIDTIACDTLAARVNIPQSSEVFAELGIPENYIAWVDKGPYTALPAEYMVEKGMAGGAALLERWKPKIAALKANNAHVHFAQISLDCPGYDIIHYLGYKGFVGAGHLWVGGDIDTEGYANLYLTPIRYALPHSINVISPFMFKKSMEAYLCVKPVVGKYVDSLKSWMKTLETEKSDLFEPWLLSHIPPGAFANATDSKALFWRLTEQRYRLWDSVWAVLLAVNNLVNKTGSSTFSSDALLEELIDTRFEGLTGFVRFGSGESSLVARGDRITDYGFYQYRQPGNVPSNTCGNNATTGKFDPALVASQCAFPPPGQYVQVASFGEELSILSNIVFFGGSSEAPPNLNKDCPAGQSYDVESASCNKCPLGTYSDQQGQSYCISCKPGFYAKEPGSAFCSACLPGTFSGIEESSSCANCSAGTYTNTVQQSACLDCNLGLYAEEGFENCVICPAGRYQNETAQGACKPCGDVYPGTTSEKGAKNHDQCYCEQDSYYRPGGVGCTTCVKGLSCPQGRATPTQMSGFYADKIDEATKEYDVFECLTESWCPEGALSSCAGNRAGRSCAVVVGVQCPFWVGMIVPICLVFLLYVMYRAVSNPQYGKVSASFKLGSNLGIALGAMQAVNVYVLLFDEVPEELHWLLRFAEFFMFKWQNIVPECTIGQSFIARLGMTALPPLIIVGINAFNWTITNLLAKTPVSRLLPPMIYADTFNSAGLLIQIMYIMQCKDAFSYFASKANPCGKDTLQDYTDVIFWSEEHVAVAPLLITSYLWLFYVIGTYGILCYVVIVAKSNLKNIQFWMKWRFVFRLWRPECYHWGCFLLLRNLSIALIPMSVRADQVYRVLAFVFIVGSHAVLEAHYYPWMTGVNNVYEVMVSAILIGMAVVGLAFTEHATDDQKNVASVFMIGFVASVWVILFASFGYAVTRSSDDALKKHQEECSAIGNDVLKLSAEISQTFDEGEDSKSAWFSYSKNLSAHDSRVLQATVALLKGFGEQDDFRKRMQSRYLTGRISVSSNNQQDLNQLPMSSVISELSNEAEGHESQKAEEEQKKCDQEYSDTVVATV